MSFFQIKERGSSVKQEIIAGLTIFLAMVYSVIVVPSMLSAAGFNQESVFIATCLVSAIGSIIMGLWANAPMAIGCAISLTAFTAFSLVLGQGVSVPVALGAIFLMGVLFTVISVTGVRTWILKNLPSSIAHGAGIGIGLFLLLIAANGVGLVVSNQAGLPVKMGELNSISSLMSIIGLIAIIALEKRKIKGSILWVMIAITVIAIIFDPNVTFNGEIVKIPNVSENNHFLSLDIMGAVNPQILPVVFALILTAIFDATGTIRALAGQANLLDKDGQIINGGKALTSDSFSSVLSSLFGSAPAAVYIESAAGTAVGGKTGLSAVVVGICFFAMLFLQPIAFLVPNYATAPALMYVGLLMLSNVSKLDFDDFIGAMAALVTAVFIVLTANIVTGIMLGFTTLVLGRVMAGEMEKLTIGTVIIAVILVVFYLGGFAI